MNDGAVERRKRKNKTYTEQDLLTGDLAVFGKYIFISKVDQCFSLFILGPDFLDVLTVCGKCKLLNYQTRSRTASFTPPTR